MDERIDPVVEETLPARNLSRREFVRTLSAATASSGLISAAFAGCALSSSQRAEATEAVIDRLGKLPKVKLGARMGNMEVARIVMCQDNSRDLWQPMLDSGMNFIHKAGYFGKRGGDVPEELKKLPRESYFVDTTVDNTSPGGNPDDEEAAYNQVITELDRTGLKYFDIFRAHFGWHTLKSFNKGDNASYRAFKRLKKEGKVKYFGVSQHAAPREPYETYMTMIQSQIDSGLIDSIQMWISYETTPEELAIIEKAHKSGIGITAMKTYRHGAGKMKNDPEKMKELKSENMVARSCIRYVLNLTGKDGKPYVDCAVSNLRNFEQFEENMGAVAAKVVSADGFTFKV